MNLTKRLIFAVLILSILLMVAAPTFAQDVTGEATSAVEATATPVPPIVVNDGGTVIIGDDTPATPPAPVDPMLYFTPVVYGAALIAMGLLGGYALWKGKTPAQIYQGAPEPVKFGVRIGLEWLINRAATTPDPNDDIQLKAGAEMLGYQLSSVDGNRIILTSKDPQTPDLTVQRVNR